ncbi:MAG: LPS-assembly protein LptD [Salinivirgaceae bacterium]|nr:LPS-assembly protein LptD [Salinivirgaceae bacterium]
MKTKSLAIAIIIHLTNYLVGYSQIIENNEVNNDTININHGIDTLSNSLMDTLIIEGNDYNSFNYNSSLSSDSVPKKKKKANVFSSKVDYNADDSTIYSIDGKKVYLFGNAKIVYEDIELTAAYIEVDMERNILYAEGVKDSLGKIGGQPVFTQGSETMHAKQITYNVKNQKGFIKGLYTEQEDGFLHSEQTKKDPNNQISLNRGKYTTCDLEHPHFYLKLSRGKVIPGKAIVASFSYLVIADIPLYPLMVPFGYFPTTKEAASGFIIPTFGEENNRGFFLRQGGYYFALNDYMDLTLKGDVYSKGSWLVGAQSKYKLRYKFSGNVNINYSKVVSSEPGLSDYGTSNQYSIKWTHAQDPKARPNSNFSANVNYATMEDSRYNSKTTDEYLSNTISSSISYRKTFANTPFSMSMNANHNQNNQKKQVNLSAPQMTFTMNKIFPFKRQVAVGKTQWYENIGLRYSGDFRNTFEAVPDSLMFTDEMTDYMKNGIKHAIPVSTSIKVLKYFNLEPSFNFSSNTYFKRNIKDQVVNAEGNDTIIDKEEKGIYNIYNYKTGLSLGTTVYGMYQYKSKWLKAIRHVATPSVSLGWAPDFKYEKNGGYIDNEYEGTRYSPYSKNLNPPSTQGKNGSVSFSLNNNVEMKVANKKDTVSGETKIKLLESLSFSTSYNMLADEFNWNPLAMSARTTLFKLLSINMSASGDFYALDSAGTKINEYNLNHNPGEPFRLTSASASTSLSFNSNDLFGTDKDANENSGQDKPGLNNDSRNGNIDELGGLNRESNLYDYDYFDIPWNVSLRYSLNYRKPNLESTVTQTLGFSGDVKLTSKWKISFSSGWDFKAKDFTYTSFNLHRDLHCWVATLNLIPFGRNQSYNFTIGVKASVLQDLKYKKNKSWQDNAY